MGASRFRSTNVGTGMLCLLRRYPICWLTCLVIASLNGRVTGQCDPPLLLPSQLCENAPFTCLLGACYSTQPWDQTGEPAGWCGGNYTIHNPQYFLFQATDTIVWFYITVNSCTNNDCGLQSAIIDGCNVDGLPWQLDNVLGCVGQSCVGEQMVLLADSIVIGQFYWLMIDGYAGQICQYTIDHMEGVFMPDITGELTNAGTDDPIICPGQDIWTAYAEPMLLDAHGYLWTGFPWPPGYHTSTYPDMSGPNDALSIPDNAPPGTYEICVYGFSGCDTTDTPICFDIEVMNIHGITGPEFHCAEEYEDGVAWHDFNIPWPGTYVQTFEGVEGCVFDSTKTFASYPVEVVYVDTLVCADIFTYEGEDYLTSAMYDVVYENVTSEGCDSIVVLDLELAYVELLAQYTCDSGIVFTAEIIQTIVGFANIQYEWFRNGVLVATGESFTTMLSGTYELFAKYQSCIFPADNNPIVIDSDEALPEIPDLAFYSTIVCPEDIVTYSVQPDSDASIIGYHWSVFPADLSYVLLDTLNSAIQIDWHDNTSGILCVHAVNSCGPGLDSCFTIQVGDGDPVVTLPPDQLLCPGQTFVLDAGGLMGTYQWQDVSTGSTSDADTFLVTQAGTYALTVTNICGSGADTVIINYISELIPPDLGPDFGLCPGESGVLYANVDDVAYLWYEGTTGTPIAIGGTADSIVITSPGIYSVQISDACTSASDTIVITSNANPPDVDLPDVLDLCQGDSVVIDAGITGVQYLWVDPAGGVSTGSTTAASSPGTYTLTVSNACGTDIDSVIINDAGAEPLVMLGEDISLCPGDIVEIIPVAMDVEAWLWQDSSTSSSLIAFTGGVVHVTGTNHCGSASDTIVVTLLPDVPVLDLGEDIAICPGETVTLAITETDVEIEWHDASTDSVFLMNDEGLVYATITNACGSLSDTVSVEVLPDIPDLNLGTDQSLCPGETITFDPGIENVDYLWIEVSSGGVSTGSTTAVTVPGMIILTISNDCGSSTDTVEVIADTDGPQVYLGEDVLACEGDTVILDAGISGVDYLWQNGSVASQFIATTSGVYHLAVSNACGSDADTIVVDIHGAVPSPALGQDTTLCDGEMLLLRSDANDETTILWQDGSDGAEFLIAEAGIYILYETNHCGAASDTMIVAYQSSPAAFDLGEDVVLCPGDSVLLIAPATTGILTWQDGSQGASMVADLEQVYSLQISNDCGVANDEVVVSFDQDVPVIDLEPSLRICPDQSVTLDVTQSFEASYLWSTGSTVPTITITQPDVYAVTVSTDCYSISDDIIIEQSDDCDSGIYVPNVFSPNNDNVNDVWQIVISPTVEITGIKCTIFDRWGNALFRTTSTPVKWDGAFKGEVMVPGVYVYVLTLIGEVETQTLSGSLTIVK